MKLLKRIPGRLIFAVTAVIVAVLCILRLFTPALWAGGAGLALSLIFALFRHGSGRIDDTAEKAAEALKSEPAAETKEAEEKEEGLSQAPPEQE
ncbi:MAG: hypothetical protein II776_03000 [Clostridia bacterium]|nr:hypothetical protein [Clostridia bacterium]